MLINKPKNKKKFSRYNIFLIIIAIIVIIYATKLVYLQIYKHDDYVDKANTTGTKFISDKAPRGKILDANGNILATNKQTYTLAYTSTNEGDKYFYSTIDAVTDILNQNKETLQDDLILKLDSSNNWYLDYTSKNSDSQKIEDIRFKRDRGLNESIEKQFKEDKVFDEDTTDYSENQIDMVNQKLTAVTPNEIFYYLVKLYNLIDLVNPNPTKEEKATYKNMTGEELAQIIEQKYSLSDLRKYIVYKDAIHIESNTGYKSVTIAKNVTQETAFIIYQKLNDLPGIDVKLEPTRFYPYKNLLASSVLGYIAPIDTTKKDKYELKGYDASGDLIGVSGIESAFEEQLKGVKGGTTVKVNSKGITTEEMFKLESYPGNDVHLTMDKGIQYAAEQSLADTLDSLQKGTDPEIGAYPGATRGAVVVVEVKTGRILACASNPGFDPNMFAISGKLTPEQTEQYFSPNLEKIGTEYIKSRGLSASLDDLFPINNGVRTDKYDVYPKPFFNYATQGLVPPGSIFKPLTAIAGLEENVIQPDTVIADTGKFNAHADTYGTSFAPESAYPGQSFNVAKALEVSCNYYFYETAYKLYQNAGGDVKALDALAEYAWKFGLGADPNGTQKNSTGIEIEENYGQVYNFKSAKKNAIFYSKFQLADSLEGGSYGNSNYVPLDYSTSDNDSENLAKAKQSLKDKIAARFARVGDGDNAKSPDVDEFINNILGDIQNIMNYSEKYTQNVYNYEALRNTKVDKDGQAKIIARTIAQFVINDKRSEMISPAQQVIAAIGQGTNAFTPMQLAQYVSTIANGGTRYSLHFVDKVTSPDGKVLQEFSPTVVEQINLKASTLAAVKDGMSKVNTDENGTAVKAFKDFPIQTAGKTGTADIDQEKQESWGRKPYANYISFAPYDNPEIAVVAVVYDGGHGGNIASIAKAVYEAYFKEKLLKENPDYTSKSESFQKYVVNAPVDNKSN